MVSPTPTDRVSAEERPDLSADALACACGRPMSRNPHPDAGHPDHITRVGTVLVCIPCTVESRHSAYHRTRDAERRAEALQAELAAAREAAREALGDGRTTRYLDVLRALAAKEGG